MRACKPARLAADRDDAAIRPMHPAEDVRQRRLAGAVLADQRVDLARHDVEGDVVERQRRAELLAQARRAHRRMAHGLPLRRTRSRVSAPRARRGPRVVGGALNRVTPSRTRSMGRGL